MLGTAAACALLLAVAGSVILDGLESALERLGLGLPALGMVVALDIWLAWRRPLPLSYGLLRVVMGCHLLLFTFFGLLGLLEPAWSFGDVSFREVSAGGDFGRLLLDSPLGALVWASASLAALAALWPRGVLLSGLAARVGARWLIAADLPGKGWNALKALFTSVLPLNEEEDDADDLEVKYLPRWDEEWDEKAPAAPKVQVEAEAIVVSSEPDEEAPFQRPLPLGRPGNHGWELPPIDLLNETIEDDGKPVDNEARSRLIVETLKSFGVDARVASINQGPTVTQFGVEPGWEVKTRTVMERDERGRPVVDKDGRPRHRTEVVSRTRVRVNRITSLGNDLALALAAPTIRIEAPVPGQPIVGIEVPNSVTTLVTLRSVIESSAFARTATRSRLALALGKGVSGEPLATDLSKMPHLLISGATGSGKSVCINSIIACLLMHNTPADVRLILVDPKRVELTSFSEVPHLAFSKVITELDEVPATLQAVIQEMEARYRRFAEINVRNLEAYNKSPRSINKLPYWVVVIDELADLMMSAPFQVEKQICRLAQLARATGIHLIVATQRPSVDVITGLIKANFPTRIAFAVSSQVDSRTIIDTAGADKLLGRGDMLFMTSDQAKPRRLQGCYVSDAELDRVVQWWADERFRHLKPDAMDFLLQDVDDDSEGNEVEADDPLYAAARELATQHSRISTSLLQRRLHIGYPRAANLIELLETAGVVGPQEGGGGSRRVMLPEGDEEDI